MYLIFILDRYWNINIYFIRMGHVGSIIKKSFNDEIFFDKFHLFLKLRFNKMSEKPA
jgi:hypothetical protein